MCNCKASGSLGFKKKFPVTFQARLALAHGISKVPLNIEGYGDLTLFFEATHDPEVLIVHLQNPNWILREMNLHLADPKSERIRVSSTSLSKEVFNLDECKGLFNITTGEISFTVSLVLKHDRFPQLSKLGIAAPVKIKILEKGKLDLKEGNLETHASTFHVSGGHMRRLTVHPGESDESSALEFKNKICTCDANITANVVIGNFGANDCSQQNISRVLICKGTPVTLCWKATGNAANTSVVSPVDPMLGIGNSGAIVPGVDHNFKQPVSNTDYTFTTEGGARCDGKYCTDSATVTVDVISTGDTESLLATNYGLNGPCTWTLSIKAIAVDPKIMVTSIRTVSCVGTTAVINNWSLKKVDVDGNISNGIVTTDFSDFAHPLVGDWYFTLTDGNIECSRGSVACFDVTIKCS
jgi:hypothetical protein